MVLISNRMPGRRHKSVVLLILVPFSLVLFGGQSISSVHASIDDDRVKEKNFLNVNGEEYKEGDGIKDSVGDNYYIGTGIYDM